MQRVSLLLLLISAQALAQQSPAKKDPQVLEGVVVKPDFVLVVKAIESRADQLRAVEAEQNGADPDVYKRIFTLGDPAEKRAAVENYLRPGRCGGKLWDQVDSAFHDEEAAQSAALLVNMDKCRVEIILEYSDHSRAGFWAGHDQDRFSGPDGRVLRYVDPATGRHAKTAEWYKIYAQVSCVPPKSIVDQMISQKLGVHGTASLTGTKVTEIPLTADDPDVIESERANNIGSHGFPYDGTTCDPQLTRKLGPILSKLHADYQAEMDEAEKLAPIREQQMWEDYVQNVAIPELRRWHDSPERAAALEQGRKEEEARKKWGPIIDDVLRKFNESLRMDKERKLHPERFRKAPRRSRKKHG